MNRRVLPCQCQRPGGEAARADAHCILEDSGVRYDASETAGEFIL